MIRDAQRPGQGTCLLQTRKSGTIGPAHNLTALFMPVTKSAKKALRVGARRRTENLLTKDIYKKAVKAVRKAVTAGSKEVTDTLSKAQSALDKAAKSKTIHKNKASRLKSRLAKSAANTGEAVAQTAKKAVKKAAPKKSTTKKTTAKKK